MPDYGSGFIDRLHRGLGFFEEIGQMMPTVLDLANIGINTYVKINELDNAKQALKDKRAEIEAQLASVQALRDATTQQQAAEIAAARQTAVAPVQSTAQASSEWISGIPNWGVALGGVVAFGGILYIATKKRK